jgi:hypothetical protein
MAQSATTAHVRALCDGFSLHLSRITVAHFSPTEQLRFRHLRFESAAAVQSAEGTGVKSSAAAFSAARRAMRMAYIMRQESIPAAQRPASPTREISKWWTNRVA